MAGQYNGSHFQQNLGSMPPIQTQHQNPPGHAFSPPSYQQSPGPMSPNMSASHQNKRQKLSPAPGTPASPAPYHSPFSAPPYANQQQQQQQQHHSPYASSPPANPYLSLPGSPAAAQPVQSFHQPQPYHHNDMNARPPPQGAMLPPKVPASKIQDNTELEKANARDLDVNNISDVLTGTGIDIRAEEEAMLLTNNRSFNSQATTLSPHGSFNNWTQGAGAFQGTGPLSQPMSQEQQEAELRNKHAAAARALNESTSAALADPFLLAGNLRQILTRRAYQNGVNVNLEGLFDKIADPSVPQNVTRTSITGANGESISLLQAQSLLNQNAPFADILSLVTLAAEERLRSILEDSFALAQGRQNTSHGVVPPNLRDLVQATQDTQDTTATLNNISKTTWEAAPDSAVSPMTVNKQMSAGRLPTPPTDGAPTPITPQPTVAFPNHVAAALKKRVADDFKYEQARIAKRQKRLQGSAATTSLEIPAVAPMDGMPKLTKKDKDRMKERNNTEEVLHRKANETASMALGGKKKYSWMTGGGGGGGGSGASTPRVNTNVGSASGTATPAQPQVDRALMGARRTYGGLLEAGDIGRKIQARDLIHVLELEGKERKTLTWVLARLKNTEKDDEKRPATFR